MKNFIIAGIFSAISLPSIAQIQFAQGSWADIKAKAKKENKYIFVDAFAEWCGPCKAMAKNVFTAKEVGEFYNKNFVSYKFDMEKGEGNDFAKTYQVQAYPTLLYFSPKGDIVHRGVGSRANEDFIALGQTSLNPESQYYTLKKRFEAGENSKEFLEKFVAAAQQADDNEVLQKIAPKIVKDIPESEWSKSENVQIVFQAMVTDETILEKVIKMRAEFENSVGVDELNNALLGTLNPLFSEAIQSKSEDKFNEIRKKIHKMLPQKDASMMEARFETVFYEQIGKPEEAKKANEKFEVLRKQKMKDSPTTQNDWSLLNEEAWSVYEQLKDKNLDKNDISKLNDAIGLIEKSIKINRNFYNVDTYAHLLWLSGNKKEAIKQIKDAIKIGKSNGENTTQSEESLKNWEKK